MAKDNESMSKAVWIENLGCPKNEVDGERMKCLLSSKGYRIIPDPNRADILILNSCGFIQSAKEESIEALFQLVDLKREDGRKKIILCGCLAQRYPRELWSKLPELDGLFGIKEIDGVDQICTSILKGQRKFRVSSPQGKNGVGRITRTVQKNPFAYLKIADGCDNRCSYCAIPEIRGGFRSKKIAHIMDEARQLTEQGVKEIDLIAQDTTLYGVDLYGKTRLTQLLYSLAEIPKVKWIRLLYTHPAHFSDELIDQIAANPKVCKYVDLPLQHISDEILKRMNRKVTGKKIKQLIWKLRERIPDLTLRTSFIVGFPGERKKHFEELLRFIEEVRFDKLGVFPYSREDGTGAYNFKGQLSNKVKQERLDQLMLIQQQIAFERNKDKVGKVMTVLVDSKSEQQDGYYIGRSQSEAPEVDGMVMLYGDGIKAGNFVKVKVTNWSDYDLIAQTLKEVKHG
jgi:ribosomal protein S12 methylthiotransferase